jgi:hypothetical protein
MPQFLLPTYLERASNKFRFGGESAYALVLRSTQTIGS